MAEPYFKDPLLAKWAAECAPETLSYIEGESAYSEPLLILELLDGNTAHSIYDDRVKLRSLVSRELSGARRAREKAAAPFAHRGMVGGKRMGASWFDLSDPRDTARAEMARQILEALDGE